MQKTNPLEWLLEVEKENPGIRYFALKDLLDLPETDIQVRKAHDAVMEFGPVPVILEAQDQSGWWVKPGSGYSPKYRATSWSLFILAELGAGPGDERIRRGCEYYLDNAVTKNEAFSVYNPPTPRGAFHCLNGNMIFAMQRLGYREHPTVQKARDYLVELIIDPQQPIDPSVISSLGFNCWVNEGKPCAWGANKAARALLETPENLRDSNIECALAACADFLLSRDPAFADYPYSWRVSQTWFKLGFPLSYWSDVLQTVSNLVELGFGSDPRLSSGLDWILAKQRVDGRWVLENSLKGKMWIEIETRGKPSKWVTLRALRVLKRAGLYEPAR